MFSFFLAQTTCSDFLPHFHSVITTTNSYNYTFEEKRGLFFPSVWSKDNSQFIVETSSNSSVHDISYLIPYIYIISEKHATISYQSTNNYSFSGVFTNIPKNCEDNVFLSNTYGSIFINSSDDDNNHMKLKNSFCILVSTPSVTNFTLNISHHSDDKIHIYSDHLSISASHNLYLEQISSFLITYDISSKEYERIISIEPKSQSDHPSKSIHGWFDLNFAKVFAYIVILIFAVLIGIVVILVILLLICVFCGACCISHLCSKEDQDDSTLSQPLDSTPPVIYPYDTSEKTENY